MKYLMFATVHIQSETVLRCKKDTLKPILKSKIIPFS